MRRLTSSNLKPSRRCLLKTKPWTKTNWVKFCTLSRKNVVRSRVLAGEPRIDGREKDMIRGLDVRTGVLPRTHGSALFTRGETQALVTATLGTARDAQVS